MAQAELPELEEARHLRRAALVAAERHYAAETRWFHSNYLIGLPAAVLSSLASAAAFQSDGQWHNVAGYIALAVAILSALAAFLDPRGRAQRHHSSAKAFEALYHRVGLFERVLARRGPAEDAERKERIAAFTDEFVQLLAASPAIPGYAYRKAAKNLQAGFGEVSRHRDDDPPSTPAR